MDAPESYLTTFTGIQFNLVTPTPAMVTIDDIAHHLAMLCHWSGACREFFSVAQHAILVSHIVPWDLRQWALLHDAAEAYTNDITRPVKYLIKEVFKPIEQRIELTIANAFHLPWPIPSALKAYDDQILKWESQRFMSPNEILHDGSGRAVQIPNLAANQSIPSYLCAPMPPQDAEIAFHARYRKLFLDEDGL